MNEIVKPKAVVVLSGGMDSATVLYKYLCEGWDVSAIAINYKQRHSIELEYAKLLCLTANVQFDVIDLSGISGFIAGSSQTNLNIPVPHGRYDEPSMKQTVVPNRNMLLLATAGCVAVQRNATVLAYGAHAGDHAIYPDCRPAFVDAMTKAFKLCDWHELKLEAPFLNLDKGEICKIGLALGVPYQLTWTCYEGRSDRKPCGKCGACVERAEAFNFAGVKDPFYDYMHSENSILRRPSGL